MSNYDVISDIGNTLVKLLKDTMSRDPKITQIITPESDIALSSPDEKEAGSEPKLILFLYLVGENPFLKNREISSRDPAVEQANPLVLDLHYLVIANTNQRNKDHLLLGKVMQTFHDHGILQGTVLQGGLAGSDERFRLVLHGIPLDSMLSLWQSFQEKSFRLSLCYQVTPVAVDSTISREVRRVG